MPFVIDDAAIAAASEVGSEMVNEVGSAVKSSCADELSSLSEEALGNEFAPEAFQKTQECVESSKNTIEEPLEKEFSPEKFSEEPVEKETKDSSVEQVERSSTFEEQTIDNSKLEEMRPELQDKLNLGQPHDADVLRANIEVATRIQTDTSISRAHHLVGNETPNAAKKLEEFGIDRNAPANGILLPNDASSPLKGSIHSGRHLQEYYNTVEQRLAQATSREEVLEALQSLKEDLFSGELPLQRDVKPNI